MAKPRKAASLGLLALEPRQMYDGAGAAAAAASLHGLLSHDTLAHAAASTVVRGNAALDGGHREIVFVDGSIPDLSQLVASVSAARPGATVAVLDPRGNELAEIAAYVSGLSDLDAIHIVSHGAAGQLDLGSQTITDANLAGDAAQLSAIGKSLEPGGEILLYGCDVAQGAAGARFIGDIAADTGRVVAASTDATGAAALGGDWVLEASTGARSATAIDAAGFDGLLGAPTITGLTALSYTGTSSADLAHTATSDAFPTITGFATPGDQLVIEIDTTSQISGTYFTGLTADVTAGLVTGAWSYTFQAPLPVGTHSVVVYDATANVSSSPYSITVDTPPSIATNPAGQGAHAVTYDQSGTPVPVDSVILVGESTGVEDYSYNGATGVYTGKYLQAQVTSGGSGSDELSFGATPTQQGTDPSLSAATQPTAVGVVSVSGGFAYLGNGTVAQQIGTVTGSGTSDLRVTFTSDLVTDAVVQALARMVQYSNNFGTVGVPLTAATVTFSLSENIDNGVQSATSVVNYDNTGGSDSAPVITLSNSSPVSVSGAPAQDVDPGLTVTGNPLSNIVQANVLIENVQPGDVLGWSASVASTYGITVSYNSSSGVLQATSTIGSDAGYQAFLRTVTFSTTSTSTVARTIDISIGAGLYYSQNGHFYEFVSDNGVSYQQAETLASETHLYGLQGYLATITSSPENTFVNNTLGGNGWIGASDAPIADSADGAADGLTIGHWHWIDGPEGLLASQGDGSAGLYFYQQDGATVLDGNGNSSTGETGSVSGELYGYRNLNGGSVVGSNYANWQSGTEPNNVTAGPGQTAILPAGVAGGGEEYAHIYPISQSGQWNDYGATASGGSISGYVVEFGGMPGDTPQTFGVTKTITVEDAVPPPVITGLTAATDTGSSHTDGVTSDQTPTVMGTAQAGASIALYQGSVLVGTTTADSSGNWTVPITSSLAAGTYPFTAQATLDSVTSANSNTYDVVIETSAPAPVITGLTAATDTGSSDSDGITSDQTPTVMGTGEAGDTLSLFEGSTLLGTTTVASNGSWTVPLTSALAAGTHDLTATETDPAGILSPVSNTYAVVIETSAPAPVITGLTAATDTGSSDSDGITSDQTPTVMGTGEAGDMLTLYEGSTVLGTVTVAANGTWVLPLTTPLAAGTHDLTATEIDPAGNLSPVSNTYDVTIETSAPAPVITGLTPATDSGSSDSDGITSDQTPTVMGTGEAGDMLTLNEGSTVLGTTVVGSNGSWTVPLTSALAVGTHDLTATETDPAGNLSPVSNTYAVTIETSAPAPVITGLTAATDTGSSDSDGVTSDQTPTVMGTGEAGDTLSLFEGSTLLGTVTVASNGSWVLPLTNALAAGTHDLTATETDPAGNLSPVSNTYAVVIETSAPAPVITGLTAATDSGSSDSDGITSDQTPTVMGTGEAGDMLTLYEGSTVLGTVTVAANGTWVLPLTTPLAAGTHDLTATEIDPAGNLSPVSNTYAVTIETSAPAPVITGLTAATDTGSSDSDGITSDTMPTVMGTGEAGATVTVSDGTTVLGTATVASNGTWVLPVTSALADGTHDLTATETDPAGNLSPVSNSYAVVIETSAPAPVITGLTPATDSGSSDSDGITSDQTPTVMGTGEAGATVTVSDGSTLLGTATVASDGTWMLPVTTALAAGTHDLTATETDPAGNLSPVSNSYAVVIETSAPAPVITGLTPATDTGSSDSDGITSDQTPTVMGTGEAGAIVTVSDGTTVLGTATVASDGTWLLPVTSALAAGTHDLTATETDPAGNLSPVSNTYAAVIETSAPAPAITGLTAATDTGSSDSDGVTSDTMPTVMGTGEAGATVTVSDGTTVLGTATVAPNGTWMLPVTAALADGTHDLTATETDPAGNLSPVSNTYAVVIETSAPAPVVTGLTAATDTGSSDSDGVTSDQTPTVMGTGEAGDMLTLYEGSTVLGTTTVAANGNWTVALTTPLGAGTHDLTATETDPAGNLSPVSNSYAVVIETSAPAPVITGLTPATDTGPSDSDGITSDATPTVMGTGEAGATVTVTDGTTVLGTATVAANGTWMLPVTSALADGTHALTATETDLAGNMSPVSAPYDVVVVMAPPTPAIAGLTAATDTGSSDSDGITSDQTPTVMGTGEAGDSLTVYDGTQALGTVTVAANGTWVLPVTSPLAAGTHDLTAVQTNLAGYPSAASAPLPVVIETSAPAPVVTGLTAATDTGSSQTDGITSDTTPTVMGTGEAGAVVTVSDGMTVLGTATVAADGTWTLAVTTPLAAGTHELTATETDQAGNLSPVSGPYQVTIETSAPAPVLTGLTPATDTGSSQTDGVTSDTTPTFMGSGEPGAVVTLYDGTMVIGTTTVASDGSWSLAPTSPLSAGAHMVTATETDQAGNVSPASAPITVTIETAAPAPALTGLTPATDTGSSQTDGITRDTIPVLMGTGQAGDTVTLYDGTEIIGTTIVGANGSWTLTPTSPLADGTHELTATQTDAAGNVSPASAPITVVIETSAPAPAITGLTPAESGGRTDDATPTVMGTGEPGAVVTLYDGTREIGTVTVGANGTWSLPITSPLSDGAHSLTATQTDPAGNLSPPSAPLAVDVEMPPVRPAITGITPASDTGVIGDGMTSDREPVLVGTAAAGSLVTIFDGTTAIGTVTADAAGQWRFTPATGLSDGEHAFSAIATDAAGVSSARSAILSIDIVPTTDTTIPGQVWLGGGGQSFALPSGLFSVPSGDTPVFSARLVNEAGAPVGELPSWITINPATGMFQGAVPTGVNGTFRIQVVLTDNGGDSAVAVFTLTYEGPSPTQGTLLATPSPIVPPPLPPQVPPTPFNPVASPVITAVAQVPVTQAVASALPDLTDIEPSLTTVTPVETLLAQPGGTVSYTVGVADFNSTEPLGSLTLSATLANGRSLPAWLTFDPLTGTLTARLPAGAADIEGCEPIGGQHATGAGEAARDAVDVLMTARDSSGHTAFAHIEIRLPKAASDKCLPSVRHQHAERDGRPQPNDVAASGMGRDATIERLGDLRGDGIRFSGRPGFAAQVRASHPGLALASQAALLRAAEQMLHAL